MSLNEVHSTAAAMLTISIQGLVNQLAENLKLVIFPLNP